MVAYNPKQALDIRSGLIMIQQHKILEHPRESLLSEVPKLDGIEGPKITIKCLYIIYPENQAQFWRL